ncbi:MAG: D-alanyl-D-alanine carboxypeptidase/D-alanyl-D-alanine-endopeptidase [Ignavibacteriales bacterium]
MKYLTRFFSACILLIILSGFCFGQQDLKSRLDVILSDSLFESTAASVDIFDLTSKEPLYQKNNKLLLRPASNMKILTTSAGLYFLGPEYNFQTSVYYTGKIVGSVCTGDIYIQGKGDPDFSVQDLDSLIDRIRALGIRKIKGNIYADVSYMDSLFWGKGWMWDDDPSTDAPYLCPLNINSNTVTVSITPGAIGAPASVNTFPQTGFFKIINHSVTISSDTSDFKWDRDWLHRTNNIVLQGKLSYKDTIQSEINVYNPVCYFLTLLKERLIQKDLQFSGTIDTAAVPKTARLINTLNRAFGEVIVNLNKQSDNLSAEMTLRALAYKFFNKPATPENGIKLVDSLITLAGLNYKSYRIVDGSGVSHYNLISSELLLGILKYMYYSRPALFNILYESFPIAGVDGSLRNRMKYSAAFNNVHAKTGTLSGVSSLSGYVTAANKHMLGFSIIIQNYTGSSRRATEIQNEICRTLAEYGQTNDILIKNR